MSQDNGPFSFSSQPDAPAGNVTLEGIPGAKAAPGAAPVRDVTTATFMADVIEASQSAPVIVDFWADWCGPCKQLTPLLERLAREAQGAWTLAKINVDQNRDLAAQLRVQSLPTVMAFRDGQPVDGFAGALPEGQLKQFIAQVTKGGGPSPLDAALEQAKAAYEAEDLAGAAQIFAAILQEEPAHVQALAGLARCYLDHGDRGRAEQTLALVPPAEENHPDVAGVRAALDLAAQSAPIEDLGPLKTRLETDPDDHQARFELALAAHGTGDRETAITQLLEIIRRDRDWDDDGARKQLLKLFEAYGPTDPATVQGRRRLSSLLFA